LKLLEEETARRIEEAIQKSVEEALKSAEVKLEIQIYLEDGRKKMLQDVAVQLKKEKQENLSQAKLKEVSLM
jgi:arginine/glutamate-rich protein 1